MTVNCEKRTLARSRAKTLRRFSIWDAELPALSLLSSGAGVPGIDAGDMRGLCAFESGKYDGSGCSMTGRGEVVLFDMASNEGKDVQFFPCWSYSLCTAKPPDKRARTLAAREASRQARRLFPLCAPP